jgi:hypothetical protein
VIAQLGKASEVLSGLPHKSLKSFPNLILIIFQFTFPYDQILPTAYSQTFIVFLVAEDVSVNFLFPEFRICLGPLKIPATMPVPEASMNKNSFHTADENNIRLAG